MMPLYLEVVPPSPPMEAHGCDEAVGYPVLVTGVAGSMAPLMYMLTTVPVGA